MDPIIVVVSLVSIGLALAVSFVLFRRRTRGDCAVTAGDLLHLLLAAVVSLCLSPLLFFQLGLMLVAALAGWALSVRHNMATAGVWLATAAAFGVVISTSMAQLAFLNRLRANYPFEPLADRLVYEQQAKVKAAISTVGSEQANHATDASAALSDEVNTRLAKQESWAAHSGRTVALERLHGSYRDRFIISQGFGYGRMAGIRMFQLREPDMEQERMTTLPMGGIRSAESERFEAEVTAGSDPGLPENGELRKVAGAAERDFLNPMRFGFVRDGKVAGFVSHRMAEELGGVLGVDDETPRWHVERVELVSLLKFPKPAVYLSDELPNMERLASVPTRPLNDFEREALLKLRTDEDLVVRYSTNTIRMLGSLRAGKTCLECHSVQRGALLGAFSYELRRTVPLPAPVPPVAKSKPEA